MRKPPKIGQRVRYHSSALEEYEGKPRECTGTVVAIYEAWSDKTFKLLPEKNWSAGVKVDAPLPEWWSYPNTDRFAPEVSELTALCP